MERVKSLIHWSSLVYYVYVFGYASLFKVFQKSSMMQSMQSLGFTKTATILIGAGELLGVALILAGLFKRRLKTLGVIYLFPFAVGAFATHMAHQEYSHFYNSLMMCVLTVVLLFTDKHFKITL